MIRFSIILNVFLLSALAYVIFHFNIYQKILKRLSGAETDNTCLVDLDYFDFHFKEQPNDPEIVLIGDSMIRRAKWDSLLNGRQVYNRGIAGDVMMCICKRTKYLKGLHAKVWFIQGGINDIAGGKQDMVLKYYKDLVSFVKSEGAVPVINLPMYVADSVAKPYSDFSDFRKINARVDQVNTNLRDYATQNGIKFIDMNPYVAKNNLLEKRYTKDGLHLNDTAYGLWANKMNEVLEKL